MSRKDDSRFDDNLMSANNPDVKFAVLDGELSSISAEENFPASSRTSIPQLLNSSDLYMTVASKKADAVIQDPYSFADFDTSNPDLLRPAGNKPLRLLAVGFPIPENEPALKSVLDITMSYILDNGFVDNTLKKYEEKARIYRVAKPYASLD